MLPLVLMRVSLRLWESLSGSCIRKNAYGQVKTSRNQKRPKPPLPPMKRTPKAPLRRSERNKGKTKEEVSAHIFQIDIQE